MDPFPRPEPREAAEYYFTYISQVPSGDIRQVLTSQAQDILPLFEAITEVRAAHRYAPDKWTIRQVLSHVNDTERVFATRAMWFARALPEPQPSFDQVVAIANADADARSWASHVAEFKAVRSATLALFNDLPAAAWSRRGVASGHEVTVRALAFITAGHLVHHARVLRERYLPS